ncbi:MAG: CinA family protein [Granulosicoccus sp.]
MQKHLTHTAQSQQTGEVGVQLAEQLGQLLRSAKLTITTAESCTGGLIAAAITDIAGSSEWFEQGAITYSNEAKHSLLGVGQNIFDTHGAVSQNCVDAMAKGALRKSGADIAIAVSGIAGPGGATEGKPVGTVWLCWAWADKKLCDAELFHFAGNRQKVRQLAVLAALHGTIARIEKFGN